MKKKEFINMIKNEIEHVALFDENDYDFRGLYDVLCDYIGEYENDVEFDWVNYFEDLCDGRLKRDNEIVNKYTFIIFLIKIIEKA